MNHLSKTGIEEELIGKRSLIPSSLFPSLQTVGLIIAHIKINMKNANSIYLKIFALKATTFQALRIFSRTEQLVYSHTLSQLLYALAFAHYAHKMNFVLKI